MKESERLLQKYVEGTATPQEQAIIEQWFADLNVEDASGFTDIQKQQQLESIRQQLPGYPIKRIAPWRRMVAAASIVLVIGAGILLYTNRYILDTPQKANTQVSNRTNDASPGKIGATLTLANGQQIKLTDSGNGEIAKESGVIVTKTADGQLTYQIKETKGKQDQMNTLSTANGETYAVILPDNSKIWLNAASSLTYSAALYMGGQRKVLLRGEAYFEVAKDSEHPFVVQTAKQEVQVLGTHFNINSYANEANEETTLLEGSVRVVGGGNEQVLKPGQQAVNTGEGITVKRVDIENIMDWKDGDFALNNVDLKAAMRKIARWYDVEIIYAPDLPTDIQTGGWISREKHLSAVLKLIESSGLVHFKVDGRKVYVSK